MAWLRLPGESARKRPTPVGKELTLSHADHQHLDQSLKRMERRVDRWRLTRPRWQLREEARMKPWRILGGCLVALVIGGSPAQAGVREWPVVGQVVKIALCVGQDAATVGEIVVRHTVEAGAEVLGVVGKCVKFVLDTVTLQAEQPHPHE